MKGKLVYVSMKVLQDTTILPESHLEVRMIEGYVVQTAIFKLYAWNSIVVLFLQRQG